MPTRRLSVKTIRMGVSILGLLLLVVAQGDEAAAQRGRAQAPLWWRAVEAGRPRVVMALLARGADVHARDERGQTALHIAVERGYAEVARVLLMNGADPQAKDEHGVTPLMIAERRGDPRLVRLLTEAEARRGGGRPLPPRLPDSEAEKAKAEAARARAEAEKPQAVEKPFTGRLVPIMPGPRLPEGMQMPPGLQIANLPPEDLAALDQIRDELSQVAGFPDYFPKVPGLSKASVFRIVDTVKAGNPITEKQRAVLDDLLTRFKTQGAKAGPDTPKAVAPMPVPSAPAAAPLVPVPVDIEERLPTAAVTANKDAYAVVVGIEKYTDLAPPDYAVRDAKWMKEYLVRVLGYPEENVKVLLNEQATRSRVQSAIETWLPNQDPRGPVLVYYSGHGAPDPKTGESYLVPSDGSPSDLKTTAYPLKRLSEALAKLPAKELIVILDACFSGQPGTRSVIAKGTKPMVITTEGPWAALGERGIVFTAGNQVSTVYEEKKHGLFTYFFLKGLQGAADQDKDGTVSVKELFAYLRPEVVKTARRQNVEQEPGLWPAPEQLGGRASRILTALGR